VSLLLVLQSLFGVIERCCRPDVILSRLDSECQFDRWWQWELITLGRQGAQLHRYKLATQSACCDIDIDCASCIGPTIRVGTGADANTMLAAFMFWDDDAICCCCCCCCWARVDVTALNDDSGRLCRRRSVGPVACGLHAAGCKQASGDAMYGDRRFSVPMTLSMFDCTASSAALHHGVQTSIRSTASSSWPWHRSSWWPLWVCVGCLPSRRSTVLARSIGAPETHTSRGVYPQPYSCKVTSATAEAIT